MQAGPCNEAFTFQREVVIDDLASCRNDAWRSYLTCADDVGLRSVVAIPLIGRGRTWGVLDLYRDISDTWSAQDLAAARLLSAVAVSYLVMAVDRDDARTAQQQLAHRNLHDQLTGLPNRALLFDRLGHALHRAARHGRTVAAFFIDLDHFKYINDTYGHAAGDAVLTEVTRRMTTTLRAEDTLARLSGDEFVLVCEDLPQRSERELDGQLNAVVARLQLALAEPIQALGTSLSAAASIGVALSTPSSSVDDLLADADAAMYRVKQRRTSRTSARPQSGGRSIRDLERDLSMALRRDELRVHYQSIVSTRTGDVVAVEALLRWQHPAHGLLVADEFIDLAERSGAIVPIGHWLIDRVCAQTLQWDGELADAAPATAYVNLDARQLNDPSLEDIITSALTRCQLRPSRLGLEVVEASFIDPQLLKRLQHHHQRGHPLAVDDFGTGYSSLSRLVEVDADVAKIDKSFVAGVTFDPRRRAVIEAVIVVAERLGLDVIGEGVESAEQSLALTAAGCHLQQGFLYGAPTDAASLSRHWRAGPDGPGSGDR